LVGQKGRSARADTLEESQLGVGSDHPAVAR
jgi:hypothetical protein